MTPEQVEQAKKHTVALRCKGGVALYEAAALAADFLDELLDRDPAEQHYKDRSTLKKGR